MSRLTYNRPSTGFLAHLIDALRGVKCTFWVMLLAAGFLLGSLTGCGGTLTVKVLPPIELLQDCPESSIDVRTNGGLAAAVPILRHDLKVCNLDKKALREWAEEE